MLGGAYSLKGREDLGPCGRKGPGPRTRAPIHPQGAGPPQMS